MTLLDCKFHYHRLGLFWTRHPALFIGLISFLIIALRISLNPYCYIPLAVVFLPLCGLRASFIIFALTRLSLLLIPPNQVIQETSSAEGTFYPHSVKEKKTSFGPQWEYQGTLTLMNQPPMQIKMALSQKQYPERPSSDVKYHIKGSIKNGYAGPLFIPRKKTPWIPIEPIYTGFSEWRFQAKKQLKTEIQKRFTSEKAARFLEGISTGDFQDPIMSLEFGRFGLQHIMAVSGFHFAVITSILCWVFFGLLGRKWGAIVLLLALLGYFIFLGGTPSITRAWISASLVMIGALIGGRVKGINSLGIGLFVVLVIDPRAITQLGFQFSFAITASILLFTGPFEHFMQSIFPQRNLQTGISLSYAEKISYIALQWFKKGTALSMAVNICALPMTLYYFEKFPLWSLFFNLFFPLMVALSLFALILGLSFGVLTEYFAIDLNQINNRFTEFMLNLTYNFPQKWDVYLTTDVVSSEILIIYLTVLFTVGILIEKDNTVYTQTTSKLGF